MAPSRLISQSIFQSSAVGEEIGAAAGSSARGRPWRSRSRSFGRVLSVVVISRCHNHHVSGRYLALGCVTLASRHKFRCVWICHTSEKKSVLAEKLRIVKLSFEH